MRLIARGYSYKEVAKELFISIKTVETHVSAVLRKLQLSSRHELTKLGGRAPPPLARTDALSLFPARLHLMLHALPHNLTQESDRAFGRFLRK